MRSQLFEHLTFVSTFIESPERIAFVAHVDKALQSNSYVTNVLYLKNKTEWMNGGQYGWPSADVVGTGKPGEFMAVGRNGDIACGFAPPMRQSRLSDESTVGPLLGACCIDSTVFAYGMRRHVFRRRSGETWEPLCEGFPRPDSERLRDSRTRGQAIRDGMGGIYGLVGENPDSLTAVGVNGEIWSFNGELWKRIDSPTNVILYDIALGANGCFFACGQSGVILRGSGNAWEIVEYDGPDSLEFFSLAVYRNVLFLADGQSLRKLENGKLTTVTFDDGGVLPCGKICRSGNTLVSLAKKEVYISEDGEHWTPIP